MRTPITLKEFLFTLNQDEDIRVCIIDYERDKIIYEGWKDDYRKKELCEEYTEWFVQDFVCITGGLEISIVIIEEELD